MSQPEFQRRLPASFTPIVGRASERTALVELLEDPDVRLVTLTGTGGTGKTRLALAVAEDAGGRFRDNVFFVELGSITGAELVAAAIARTLDVADSPAPAAERLGDELRDRELLLVLDNFEHVLDAAATVVRLLQAAPRVKALVTSRVPLRVSGERQYPVSPLTLPDHRDAGDLEGLARNEAVELFVARAREVAPGFQLAAANAEAVVNICVDVDGLPLALELAAARTAMLTPEELAGRLGSRLELLTGGRRDAPARQQTLRAAIDWSFDLLEHDEQALLARLSVFAGGFALEGAETVCDAHLVALGSLVEQSLVRRAATDAEPRFGLLDTIREYAAEQLADQGDAEAVHRRHAEHYLWLAEQASEVVHGGDQALWWRRLDDDHGNVRAALGWAEAVGDVELELRLVTALWPFWLVYGYIYEGRARCEHVLARAEGAPDPIRAAALHGAGAIAYRQSDYARARELFEASLELHERVGNEVGTARLLGELGNIAVAGEQYDEAMDYYEQAVGRFRSLDESARVALVVANMGAVANLQGDYARGRALLEEALALQQERGNDEGASISLHNLARIDLRTGHVDDAAVRLAEGLELARALSYRELIAYCIEGLGEVAAARGDLPCAARLVGACEPLLAELGISMVGEAAVGYGDTVALLRRELGEQGFERERSAGQALPVEEGIAAAFAAAVATAPQQDSAGQN